MGVIGPQQKTWARTPEGDCLAPGGHVRSNPSQGLARVPLPRWPECLHPCTQLGRVPASWMEVRGSAQHPTAQIWPPIISGSLQNPTTDNRCHSVSSEPHTRHLGIPSEPYTRYLSILLEPHTKCIRNSPEPYTRHIRVPSELHTTHCRIPSESHTRHLRVPSELYTIHLRVLQNLTQNPL